MRWSLLLLSSGCFSPKSGDTALPCGEGTHAQDGLCVADDLGGDDTGASEDSDSGGDSGADSVTGDTDSGTDSGGDTDTGEGAPPCDVDASGGAAYTDIQEAVDDATEGDTIRVCPGTYSWVSMSGVSVSLEGVEGSAETIIDGGNHTALTIADTRSAIAVSGFTLTGAPDEPAEVCGAWLTSMSGAFDDIVLSGCANSTNSANIMGMWADTSDTTWENLVVEDNALSGVLFADSNGSFVLRHSVFRDNTPPALGSLGGMLYVDSGDAEVSNNLFYNNEMTAGDSSYNFAIIGGVSSGASVGVYNNVFYGNTGSWMNKLIALNDGTVFENNIVFDNMGGVGGSATEANYNAVYGNTYGNIVEWVTGTDNLERDPAFTGPDSGDFSLDPGFSPCIDAGDPLSGYNDADGSRNDMGAYGGPSGTWP